MKTPRYHVKSRNGALPPSTSPLLPLLLLLLSAMQVQSAVRFWSGAGFNNYWTTIANWNGAAPVAGDDLVFPGGVFADSLNNTNDFPDGTAFRSITFQAASTNYVLNGNRVVFSDSTQTALSSFSSGTNRVRLAIELGVNQTFETLDLGALLVDGAINLNGYNLTNYTTADISIRGAISGAGDLVKTGSGRLLFNGFFNNTYEGVTRVEAGVLELNDTGTATEMIPGDVVISPGARLVLGEDNQIADTANITVQGTVSGATAINGLLNLSGFSEVIGSLTLRGGGDVATGAGTLSVQGDITASASGSLLRQNSAVISGNLSLGSLVRTVDVADNSYVTYDLEISGDVSGAGSAGITKTGAGYLVLSGANSYRGLTTVRGGTIHVASATCFGDSAVGTVLDGGSLVMQGMMLNNEWLTNNSTASFIEASGQVTSRWSSNVVLNADLGIYVTTNSTLELAGAISGTGGITKHDPGTLRFSGDSVNTYGGVTTVNEGQLELNKGTSTGAIPSAGLVIGDGAGIDTVRCLQSFQLWSAVKPVIINSSGVLDLSGFIDMAAPLTMDGGVITTGTGMVYLAGLVTVLTNADRTATIDGNAHCYRSVVITNAGYPGKSSLTINASISSHEGYGITKTGQGEVYLMASNSFSGPVTVDQGKLKVFDSCALGNTDTPATVNAGATLHLSGNLAMGLKPLVLNGSGWTGSSFRGALAASDGVCSWTGPVTNASDCAVYVYTSRTLELSGPISGPGSLTKTGAGTNILSGSIANTYAGTTLVSAGTLVLDKSAFDGAVPGNLVIGDGVGGANADVLRLAGPNQIANGADVTVASSGSFELNGQYDRVDAVTGSGAIALGSGHLLAGNSDSSFTFGGLVTGTGYLWKVGSGTWTLTADNTYLGTTVIETGTLLVNGSQPASDVAIGSAGVLGGVGTVGRITSTGGAISPGTSPGTLTCSNLLFDSTSEYLVDLTSGGYGRLNVRGKVGLAGASLILSALGLLPDEGQQFVILENDDTDAVTGLFAGLVEGAVVSAGARQFHITYHGGSGNDVVLTATNTAGLRPSLAIESPAAGTVMVSWPQSDIAWRLHATTNLAPGGVWAEIPPPYVSNLTDCTYVEPASATNRFYRLRYP